jgi:hypothetical protein
MWHLPTQLSGGGFLEAWRRLYPNLGNSLQLTIPATCDGFPCREHAEDLPDKDNRVTLNSDGEICVHWKPNNLRAHERLIRTARKMLLKTGNASTVTLTHRKPNDVPYLCFRPNSQQSRDRGRGRFFKDLAPQASGTTRTKFPSSFVFRANEWHRSGRHGLRAVPFFSLLWRPND